MMPGWTCSCTARELPRRSPANRAPHRTILLALRGSVNLSPAAGHARDSSVSSSRLLSHMLHSTTLALWRREHGWILPAEDRDRAACRIRIAPRR